jgi:hypothetical protein
MILQQLVYLCWIIFETVFCYVFIIETKGRSLEETAAIFDGEDAQERIAAVAHNPTDVHEVNEKESMSDGAAHV